jgi:hypothetical protein
MTATTRQCVECARVFELTGRGRPPIRCERCKSDHEERLNERANGRKEGRKPERRVTPKVEAPAPATSTLVSRPPASSAPVSIGFDYTAVMDSLRGEIEKMERAIALRRQALEALAFLAAGGE